jgi:streptogramin lyase
MFAKGLSASALVAGVAAILLTGCGRHGKVLPDVSPTPTASPTATPTPANTSTPGPRVVAINQGLNFQSQPYAIFADNSNIWFTDRGFTKAIGVVPQGQTLITEMPIPWSNADPLDITYATSNGCMQFTQASGSIVGAYCNATNNFGQFNLAAAPTPMSSRVSQRAIGVDSAGEIWVVVGDSSATTSGQGVYTMNTMGPVQGGLYHLSTGGYDPVALAFDASGNAWIAERAAHRIDVMDAASHIILRSVSLGNGSPSSIVKGGDGLMYVADPSHDLIYVVNPVSFGVITIATSSGCEPTYLASGNYNDIWFTESGCNAFAHLLSGQITEYKQSGSGKPDHIAVDRSGNVWYTDANLHELFEASP